MTGQATTHKICKSIGVFFCYEAAHTVRNSIAGPVGHSMLSTNDLLTINLADFTKVLVIGAVVCNIPLAIIATYYKIFNTENTVIRRNTYSGSALLGLSCLYIVGITALEIKTGSTILDVHIDAPDSFPSLFAAALVGELGYLVILCSMAAIVRCMQLTDPHGRIYGATDDFDGEKNFATFHAELIERRYTSTKIGKKIVELGLREIVEIQDIPYEIRCPLSLDLMYEPVVFGGGQAFDRAWVNFWLDKERSTSSLDDPYRRANFKRESMQYSEDIEKKVFEYLEDLSRISLEEGNNSLMPFVNAKLKV